MIKLFYLLYISKCVLVAQAQQDYTKQKPVLKDTVRLPIAMDSLSLGAKNKSDSLQSKLRDYARLSSQIPNPSVEIHGLSPVNKMKEGTSSLEGKAGHKIDSLSPQQEVAQYNRKVQLLQKHLAHHVDSLGKLPKTPQLTHSMDSLKGKLDSLQKAGPVKDIKKAEQQLAKLQTQLNSKVKGLEGKMRKELGDVNVASKVPAVNLPSVNTPGLNLPAVNAPNLKVPGISTQLPGVSSEVNANLPVVNVPSAAGNTAIPSVNTNAPSIPNTSLPTNELNGIQKETQQLTQATGQLGQVQKEIQNVNSGNLDNVSKDLEKTALNEGEIKTVSGEIMKAEDYKKMVAKWESDPEYRKEMAVTKAKEQAVNHFAGQEQQLATAMNQLTSVKQKYKDYEGTLDMFKKPGNAMKGKPFMERLRPGFNFQIQSAHEMWLDINPQVGYRISGRITAGVGWNERWGVDFNKWKYISNDHIYGPRAFAQVKIKSGIFAMIAPEVMNALIPPSYNNSNDPATRKWVWSWMAGIKKEFRVSKRAFGNLQVLYNLYNPSHQSPYVSSFNVRMGFEFPMRKNK